MDDHADGVLAEVRNRLTILEERYSQIIAKHFNLEKDLSLMQRDLQYIRHGQDKISQGVNKVLWTIVLALLAAVMTFIIKGGLIT